MKDKKTVAILTNFQDFNPSHSLAGIAVSQAHMLAKYGHKVHIFVNEHFNPGYNQDIKLAKIKRKYPDLIFIHKKSKFMHLIDYNTQETLSVEHKSQAEEAGKIYAEALIELKIDRVFTHDFIFTGWNLPYANAVKVADKYVLQTGKKILWLHWIHSVPTANSDWWNLPLYGDNHVIAFPNRTEIKLVADQFNTNPSFIRTIPHIVDIRSWYDFADRTIEFIDRYPKMMQADIIQVYPCSSDRLAAKQLDIVIKIFAYLKKAHVPVFLIAANQWATGLQRKENINKYIELAEFVGLNYGEDFVFTSEFNNDPEFVELIENTQTCEAIADLIVERFPKIDVGNDLGEAKTKVIEKFQPYARGIDSRMLRELQLIGNLLCFPTKEESFGLVGPETSLSGALIVGNRSLAMMREVLGDMMPNYDFGSHSITHEPVKNENYIRAVAYSILNRMYNNEAVMTKIHCRKRYNMDYVYHRFYLPNL